jgi:hypothetical protein
MAPHDSYLGTLPLHGVIAPAEFGGVEEDAENLDIMPGRNARNDDAHYEEADSAQQRVQQRENGTTGDQGDEEQSSFRAENGQGAVHRFEDFVLP